ncbi:MAG: hypothetical protein J6X18_17530 [Bacteroidales bacterium]|nr:hypothetical protein [Bacteroidales bacterium]
MFSNLPDNLQAIEKLFTNNFPTLQFDFEEERPNSIDEIAPDSYTPINEEFISKKLELSLPKPSSPKEKFYQAIVNAEIQRVKLAIINYAPKQRSNIDTRKMITSTLKSILHFAKQDSLDNEPIISALRIQLICFYVELVAIALPLLTQDKHYLSYDDLMFEVFQHYPQDNEITAYQTFVSSLKTEKSIYPDAKTELPSSEEYKKESIQTNYEIFVEAVKDFQFDELEKIKMLNKNQKFKLIRLIVENPVGYSVVMLNYVGYFDMLKHKFNMNKENSFKHVGKALQKSPRIIKGNYNILNPKSKEDPSVYNSQSFIHQVEKDYEYL